MSEVIYPTKTPAFDDIKLEAGDIAIRTIGLDDVWLSLKRGYADFNANPGAFPFLMLYFPLFVALFSLFALNEESRYLLFPIVAGFTLVGPLVAVVFFEMSRSREAGLETRWGSMFRFIHTHSFAPILALSLMMTVLYVAWLSVAELIWFGTMGDTVPGSMTAFVNEVLTTRHGWALVFYGCGVGFLFAFAAMALSVISFPLALDKPVTAMTAVKVSIRAFTANFNVLAVYGLVVALLMAFGTALFFLGLAFVLPILGHTTWHLYRRLVA